MNFDFLETYISPEVLILIPVLYMIGIWLRQTPRVPDWADVWIKLIIAIAACIFLLGLSVDAFLQGVLVAGGSSLIKDLVNRTQQGIAESKLPAGVDRDPDTGQFVSKSDKKE